VCDVLRVLCVCCVLLFLCSALEFVWSQDSSDYATREAGGRVKVFKNFTEKATVKIEYAIEGMHGGALIGE
jgi:coatomer subunit beta'